MKLHIARPKSGRARALTLCVAVLLSGGASIAFAAVGEPVRTEAGLVAGLPGRDASVTVFKGVPYASAPVGELRWRAPQAPAAWQGVRNAHNFAPACPQNGRLRTPVSEDCLYLNVWTAAKSGDERRPVLVWIHGNNAFTAEATYDGEGLARKGLVVVTIDYRNGVLSQFASPELTAESGRRASTNFGYLDQIQALKWVKQNIAAFGGDPATVTIAGQSHGAASVLHLVNSPLARGLFHRAIAESGARNPNDPELSWLAEGYGTLADNERNGAALMQAHNIHSMKEMRAVPLDDLLAWTARKGSLRDGGERSGFVFRTALDGYFMPGTYTQSLAKPPVNDVPLMTGNNADESGAEVPPNTKLVDYLSNATRKFGAMSEEFLRLYPAATDLQAGEISNSAARDASRVSTYTWGVLWSKTARSALYTYYWTRGQPGKRSDRGAFHGAEMDYVFNSLAASDLPWTEADFKAADIMSSYVVNFARTGNPNGAGLPLFEALDTRHKVVNELGGSWTQIPLADPLRLDFWKRFYLTQPAW